MSEEKEPWLIVGAIWIFVFLPRMLIKDYKLSKKAGWKEYS